jgi:hypothetical protein
MPVIVLQKDELTWLGPAVSDPGCLLSLLRPYPPETMEERRGDAPSGGSFLLHE